MQTLSFEPMLDMIANPSEAECVLSDQCESRFYRLWALKEAVLKALEVGLAGGAKIVRVPIEIIVTDGRATAHTPYGPCDVAVQSDGQMVAAIARYC